jgi:hypothetical protein
MIKKHSGILCLLSMVALFAISSCGEYESLEIQKKAKRSADSLFRIHKDSLKKLGDTLCDIHYPEYFDKAFDSIKADKFIKVKELMRK